LNKSRGGGKIEKKKEEEKKKLSEGNGKKQFGEERKISAEGRDVLDELLVLGGELFVGFAELIEFLPEGRLGGGGGRRGFLEPVLGVEEGSLEFGDLGLEGRIVGGERLEGEPLFGQLLL